MHNTTTTTTDRRPHPVNLYISLVAALTGTAEHCRLNVAVIEVLYQLDPADRAVMESFVTAAQDARGAYCLTTKDVAKRLRVSVRTIERLARSGALPGLLAGGRWVFTEAMLDTFTMVHSYVNGDRIHPDDGPDTSRVDTDRLDEARQALGAALWTTKQLAAALGVNREAAYLLTLGWHAAYLVNHCEQRGYYRFASPPA